MLYVVSFVVYCLLLCVLLFISLCTCTVNVFYTLLLCFCLCVCLFVCLFTTLLKIFIYWTLCISSFVLLCSFLCVQHFNLCQCNIFIQHKFLEFSFIYTFMLYIIKTCTSSRNISCIHQINEIKVKNSLLIVFLYYCSVFVCEFFS